jgi:tetratricopeptide (TPR) repeat protein
MPDETGLWQLLRQQRYTLLRRQIVHLQQTVPSWHPPPQLLTLLQEGEAQQASQHAIQQQDWSAVLTLARRYPQHFTCQHIDHLWALADAYHAQGEEEAVLSVYERIIPGCENSAHRLATLQKAIERLSADAVETLVLREAQVAKDPEGQARFADVRYQFSVGRLLAATDAKAFAEAITIGEALRQDISHKRDVRIATLLGWTSFQAERFASASDWFAQALTWDVTLEDAAYGLALSHFRQQDWQGAEGIARQWQDTSPRLQDLLGDILFARAGKRYQAQAYSESLALAQESERYRPNRRETRLLTAWTYYALERPEQAAEEFAALYRMQPDEESARGVFSSYARAQDWSSLEALTRNVPGPLSSLWRAHLGQRLYDRRLFLSAVRTTPEQFPQLRHIDSPGLITAMVLREKSGRKGLGKLDLEKLPLVEGTLVHNGVHRLSLRFERVALSSGHLAPNAPIGSFPRTPTGYSVRPTTRLSGGLEPYLSYSREGWLAVYAEVGLTPGNGEVASKPIWKVGFVKQYEAGNWSLAAFSQPVRDSLLSYTGIVDPYSGKHWGRVRRTGLRFSLYAGLNERWGLFGQASGAELRGEKVEVNHYVGVSGSIARTFVPTGFAYMAVGPRFAFDHYRKDLSQFTLGQGGYFSPSQLFQVGLGANFLTAEARRFVLSGDLSAGFQTHQQSSSPFFPHNPDGRRYAASTNRGLVFSTELKTVLRLSDHWYIGAGFAARKTADYDDKSFMVSLHFLFEPHAAVVSTDIPTYLFQTIY